jgi:acyl transferase domain-containing protein
LNTLGQLWIAGTRVDWSGFSAGERRQRVTLPTYPFERQRYWIEPANPSAGNSNPIVPAAKTSDIAEWFYVPSWKRALASQMDHSETIKSVALSWLVFVDDYGVGKEIVSRLKSYGQSVIGVRAAEKFSKIGDDLYTISRKPPLTMKTCSTNSANRVVCRVRSYIAGA